MKATAIGLCVCCLSILGTGCPSGTPEEPATPPAGPTTRPAAMTDVSLSGPFVHENLAVFLVHSTEAEPDVEFMTLEDAVKANKLIVHETGDVGQLAVENNDPKVSVYIQAGFIVKGGRQDRVLASDLLVPPNSGKVQIASFCVESGRWTGRGGESAAAFNSASKMVAGNDLKYAARHANNQSLVWATVAESQDKLSANAGVTVNDPRSLSSMQLALENPVVEKEVKACTEKLAAMTKDKADVVGIVIAVNGEVRSADVYTSRKLFAKLYPKLLESAAVEALRDLKKDQPVKAVKQESVRTWMADADRRKTHTRDLANGVQVVDYETSDDIMSDTVYSYDASGSMIDVNTASPVMLHRSLMIKPEDAPAPAPHGGNDPRQQVIIENLVPTTRPSE